MKNKTQREWNLEYYGRVHDMCDDYNKQHGTNIQPQQCVKYYGNVWDLPIKHPVFDDNNYDLAVAIIDDTPVFVGYKIYTKRTGQGITVTEGFLSAIDYTLTPPKKKRTFDLNGQQLPCPSNNEFCDTYLLDILGEYYYFESMEDRNKVAQAIKILFNNARDKE
jgi:hypothetical protein